jgi:hypothetical protein
LQASVECHDRAAASWGKKPPVHGMWEDGWDTVGGGGEGNCLVRNTTNRFRNVGFSWRQKLRLRNGLPAVSFLQAVVFDCSHYRIRCLQLHARRPLYLTAVTIKYATYSCVPAGRCISLQSLSNKIPAVACRQVVVFDCSHYRIRCLQLRVGRPLYLTSVTIE